MNKGEIVTNIQIKKKQINSLKIEERMLQDKIAEVREKIQKEEDYLKKLNKKLKSDNSNEPIVLYGQISMLADKNKQQSEKAISKIIK